jgi:4'-phosphopantetheinyl transferase
VGRLSSAAWLRRSTDPEKTSAAVRVRPVWAPASSAPRLGEDEIHVWCAVLADFYLELPRLEATLTPDERLRARSFKSPDDRDAFVMSRGILRHLLAQYLGRAAAAIAFSYGRFGKPEITGLRDHVPLYFNTSRSGALVIYAMTSAGPLGVDVERLRPVPELGYIAAHFLPPGEARMLPTRPPQAQIEAFFAGWTRTEAFLKATGRGLAGGHGSRHARAEHGWHFHLFRPAAGYLATLAHRPDGARLRRPAISGRLVTSPLAGPSYVRMHEP